MSESKYVLERSPPFQIASKITSCSKVTELECVAPHRSCPPREVEHCPKRMKPYASRPHEVCALPTRIGSVDYARNHAGIHAEMESLKKIREGLQQDACIVPNM